MNPRQSRGMILGLCTFFLYRGAHGSMALHVTHSPNLHSFSCHVGQAVATKCSSENPTGPFQRAKLFAALGARSETLSRNSCSRRPPEDASAPLLLTGGQVQGPWVLWLAKPPTTTKKQRCSPSKKSERQKRLSFR